MHRELIFGHRAAEPGLPEKERERALKVLGKGGAVLPKATVLRCRVRYFTDGAILGTQDYVRGFIDLWQVDKGRKHPPKANVLRGADWQDLACIRGLQKIGLWVKRFGVTGISKKISLNTLRSSPAS